VPSTGSPPPTTSPKVFVSYSHDSPEHEDRVLGLVGRLRNDGIDALIDQYVPAPKDGWPVWMDLEMQKADFVLLVCTNVYLRRVEGREDPGKGRGVLWEGKLIYSNLYFSDSSAQKYIPILFENCKPTDIPTPLRTMTYYSVGTENGYDDLYRRLTNQPKFQVPSLGKLKPVAPLEPQSYPASLEARTVESSLSGLDRRNRLAMLKRVREDWIQGVLKQSLYKVARIELGLESDAGSVEQPLNATVQVLDQTPASVPPGANIADLFDDHGSALLILGAPGTGKTTLLLELAQQLLDRAERDEDYPIPVVFNLSSWAVRRQPLAQWLVSELNERSDVPKKLAQRWVENEQILPLLDGLDEVAASHREVCVDAINTFRRGYGLLPIAVCSRIADYEALGTKLRLRHALVVQPLVREQIEDYLTRGGEALQPLRSAVEADLSLAQLLETPLMLWVAMLAFRNAPLQVSKGDSAAQQTRRLFDGFVNAMFKRRSAEARYGKEQTLAWLSWLASALFRRKQTVFYLENLNLDWFSTPRKQLLAKAAIITVCASVVGSVVWLGFNGALLNGGHGWFAWLSLILFVFTALGGLLGGPICALTPLRPVDALQFRLTGLKRRALQAIPSSLIGGALFGFLFALIVGLVFESLGGDLLRPMLFLGLPSAPLFGFLSWLVAWGTTESVEARQKPNQGTRDSIKNSLILLLAGLVLGLTFGLALSLLYGYSDDDLFEAVIPGVISGAGLGLFCGLVAGLIGGGLFASKQFVIRLLFWMCGAVPFKCVSFLEFATEQLFLRKVGGGYIFVHRSILEYFAESGAPEGLAASLSSRLPNQTRRLFAATSLLACMILSASFCILLSTRSASDLAQEQREQTYISALRVLQEAENKARSRTNQNEDKANSEPPVPLSSGVDHIKHVIVVMLENRSFDRMLGALKSLDPRVEGLAGDESNPGPDGYPIKVQPVAEFTGALKPNPDRSFAGTDLQIFGDVPQPGRTARMNGFVASYRSRPQSDEHSRNVMHYFSPEKAPVLSALALEFAVCDHWFSSVPGNSIPNHAYVDYGTSFGRVGPNVFYFDLPLESIYDRLMEQGRSARIYQHGPTTLYLPLFLLTKQHPELFGTLQQFLKDARAGNLPDYSFVEPDYLDRSGDEGNAPSTEGRPVLSADEFLIAQVYNSLRGNPSLWQSSVLLITYSTHGGFYDHVPPPAGVPDGFVASAGETGSGTAFSFDRLGVRVPAIIISPYIQRGTVDPTVYEHASIPATLAKLFLPRNERVSYREKFANTFEQVLTLRNPRANSDTVSF
jgi:phospholipase C